MQTERTGIWLSNIPARPGFDMDDPGDDDAILELVLNTSVEEIFGFEIIDTLPKPHREFLVKADWINSHLKSCLISDGYVDPSSVWNEYPPGEPQKTLDELEREAKRLVDEGLENCTKRQDE